MQRVILRVLRYLAILSLLSAFAGAAPAFASSDAVGAVYTQTNAAAGNSVLVFDRAADGSLSAAGQFWTGGSGTGASLGSQGAVTVSHDGRWLFVVDAGSNDIATFTITKAGLSLVGHTWSGGVQPVSVTTSDHVVYALNAGGTPNISGFTLGEDGIAPLSGSTQTLTGSAAAQIQFSRSGDVLVVTEKSGTIESFVLDKEGVTTTRWSRASNGATPFGFAIGHRDEVFVTEAAASTTSSYSIAKSGRLDLVSPSVATTQAAACWAAVTKDGRFVYTANAGSGSISAYAVQQDGSITLSEAQAAFMAGAHPLDLATSENSRFLYVLESNARRVRAFRIGWDGGL
ncbi:MAG: hypothetical protein AUH85_04065, partial [Chloroflexi bacterium 13_1_40CM_4_68_4]